MQLREFDVVQPPNAGELETLLRDNAWLGSVVVDIVVLRRMDELAIRRADDNPPVAHTLTARQAVFGADPFIVGHLDDNVSVVARLEVVNEDGVDDTDRKLMLTVFDPTT